MNGYDHESLLQGCLSLLGRILMPGGTSFAQTGLWKINSVSSVLRSYKENTHLRQEYLLPGLFWWPQICDSLPSHRRIQTPGDPWCPSQCRKFHEQHGDAEGPGDTQRKNMFQGTHPSSCWWIREKFLPCVKGPRGLGKAVWYRWKEKELRLPLRKGGLPSWSQCCDQRSTRTAHMGVSICKGGFPPPADASESDSSHVLLSACNLRSIAQSNLSW